jgi:lipopolysaccharide biosynthesis regulator YciM
VAAEGFGRRASSVAWLRGRRARGTGGDADAALRRALHAVLERDLAGAESELADAVRRDSQHVDAYLALAAIFRQQGEIGRAIHLHQNLLLRRDLEPAARFQALLGLADDFREGGFLRRAIAAYEEVLARDPREARALRALVKLLVDAREPARAIPLARRLARLGADGAPSEATLWVELADVERGAGRTQRARKALRRALRLDGAQVRAWVALGEVEAELGRTKQALAAWRRVPEVDRRAGPLVYPRLAASFAALGDARGYEAYLRELLAGDSEDAGARLALARALAARGAVEDALLCAREVLEQGAERLEAHAVQGRILLAEGRDAEVVKAHAALLDLLERERVRLPGDASDGPR